MPILARHSPVSEMSITCIAATLLAILLLPLLVLLWATESRQQRARRWRRDGLTYRVIAERLGCSQTTARRLVGVGA